MIRMYGQPKPIYYIPSDCMRSLFDDKSLAKNPDNVLTWATKGDILIKLRRHDEAEAAFAKTKEFVYKG